MLLKCVLLFIDFQVVTCEYHQKYGSTLLDSFKQSESTYAWQFSSLPRSFALAGRGDEARGRVHATAVLPYCRCCSERIKGEERAGLTTKFLAVFQQGAKDETDLGVAIDSVSGGLTGPLSKVSHKEVLTARVQFRWGPKTGHSLFYCIHLLTIELHIFRDSPSL